MKKKLSIIIFSILFSILIWGSVTLSEQFQSTENLKLSVINQPDGYTCGKIEPKTISIKLRAKGWQLLTLNIGSQPAFLLSADNDSGLISFDPLEERNENAFLSSGYNILEIYPRSVSAFIEKIAYKKLKIETVADLSFADGYGLATPIRIYPDSVLVAGPESMLRDLNTLKTKPVSFSSMDTKLKIITELQNLLGFNKEINNVELTFDVQRIVEKSFENIKVNIIDIPDDRNVVLLPNSIEVSLRGGINILGKVSAEQIIANVNYRDIVYDSLGAVQPEIIIPDNTTLVYTKPARLNYIIKKFE